MYLQNVFNLGWLERTVVMSLSCTVACGHDFLGASFYFLVVTGKMETPRGWYGGRSAYYL